MSKQRADNVAKIAAPPVTYRYFKYLVPGEGRNPKDVLDENYVSNKDIFIVHDESTWGYYLFNTYDNFENWYYGLEDKTMHEVIFGENPQRLKFDIDASKEFMDSLNVDAQDKGEYILENVTEAIMELMETHHNVELREDDFSIATSIGPEKFSAHVILRNFVVANNREATHLTKLMIEDHLLEPLRPCVDAAVNKSIQNFRLLHSHKVGSTRTKVPCGQGYLKEVIISHPKITVYCELLPPKLPETEHKNY